MPETRENLHIIEEYYDRYLENPSLLDESWRAYFRNFENGVKHIPQGNGRMSEGRSHIPFAIDKTKGKINDLQKEQILQAPAKKKVETRIRSRGMHSLVDAYRSYGYLAAKIDPLGMAPVNRDAIDIESHDFTKKDFDREFDTDITHLSRATLRQTIACLEECYCNHLAIEYMYLRNQEERKWIGEKIEEMPFKSFLSDEVKLTVYKKVFQAHYFELFLGQKYVGKKRFSLEGSDSFIPLMNTIVEESGRFKVTNIVVGMAHRGRLNVLSNIFYKPAQQIFAEFEENYNPQTSDYGDVKYHLGYSSDRRTRYKHDVHLSLMFNPSHLESANPVVLGSVKARQNLLGGEDPEKKVIPILIHGDAAFMGQGVSAETLNLAQLKGYRVGGTIHVVINNQIGFTTLPNESRSTEFATDLAKGFQVPIFHVNNDHPLQVYQAAMLAFEYRQTFGRDVVIDLVSYRRRGHNETDEPAFTQPQMYKKIAQHQPAYKIYREQLLKETELQESEKKEEMIQTLDGIEEKAKKIIYNSFEQGQEDNVTMEVDSKQGIWAKYENGEASDTETKELNYIDLERQIKNLNPVLTKVPEDFKLHPKLNRFLKKRGQMLAGKIEFDWSMAEALAFGTILIEGYNIRLSGQDTQRGTFAQRHAVYTDSLNGNAYVPLNHIEKGQGHFTAINSPLSEYSILGYEYGYSLSDPRSLVIWEAQFGDFINGAQIIVDQFITSSFVKWYRLSALVLLLPHGYEGQGPEHSSARPERFLQLCANNNMKVVNCSRPDQYFHILRRQIIGKRRSPLIIFSPKSMLRLPQATSSMEDLLGNKFNKIIIEPHPNLKEVKVVIICSGKIVYEILEKYSQMEKKNDFLIIRLEQFYPFPHQQMTEALSRLDKLQLVRWVQEEPVNQGAWFFVESKLERDHILNNGKKNIRLECIARKESASPAAGLMKIHIQEQQDLIRRSLAPINS